MSRPPADLPGRARRARDLAVILPVLGAVLLLPPAVQIFAGPATLLGIPVIVVYLFGSWAALLVAAALIARRLREPGDR